MNAAEIIRHHEGLRLRPYLCTSKKLTIGYGRNLEDRGLTRQEADYLLENDLHDIRRQLVERIDCWDQLSEVRQAVLIDMAYNLGLAGLLKFKNTLAAVSAGRYKTAACEMLDSRWAKQVGARANRLAAMMATNRWPKDFK
ncbi:glycoside hydrolase family protein [Sansalvadorimonas verongulae]|uniref:glycoside hydrolase family protein n=1 Tax=Sansalvadorimonas verongulae TaxID=2172824 RepID=UPI0012BBBD4B|nr:glycoside hydrolase family protein [Sansalvadorimonas verongulae]MTI12372.1 hypothetical protein [Sansalvadorimonas verongulae]